MKFARHLRPLPWFLRLPVVVSGGCEKKSSAGQNKSDQSLLNLGDLSEVVLR